MATVRDWADAYLEQARADLKGAQQIGGTAPSVTAMLLQMAFEKMAKAALLRSSMISLERTQASHVAASRMVQVLRRHSRLLAPMGGPQLWDDVLSTVVELERAHPQLACGGPQLEYPWATPMGAIQWPARDLGIALALGDTQRNLGNRVLKFAALFADRFDQIWTK